MNLVREYLIIGIGGMIFVAMILIAGYGYHKIPAEQRPSVFEVLEPLSVD